MPHETDRPIMTLAQLYAVNPESLRSIRCLISCREFLRLIEALTGYRLTRRALQFYSSPQARLMPLPVYAEGHRAHYLHPEHTLRLGAALRLQRRHFLPLKVVREVMEKLPPEFFGLVIREILSADEVRDIALGDASAPFSHHLTLERRARSLVTGSVEDLEHEDELDASELRAALTGFDDATAQEMAAPSDLEGAEDWLLEPRDHFMSEQLVGA